MADIDGDLYRKVLGCFPTGVTVVTAMSGDDPVAMVIGSFGSVSMDPPLVQFMPGKSSSTWAQIEAHGKYCVNVLGEDDVDVCNAFFRKEVDPFTTIEWSLDSTGSPRLHDALAWIDCEIENVVDGGDHWIVLGRVISLEGNDEGGPLLFFRGGYGRFTSL